MPADYQNNQEYPETHPSTLPESFIRLKLSQKIAVAVLAFFAVFVFGAWLIQFKNSIVSPLARPSTTANNTNNNVNSASICTGPECTADQAEELKLKDTDKDGLNDYEELEVYKTSPYLADSDSDGFSDKSEIDSGNNPNCPSGATCNNTAGFIDLKPEAPVASEPNLSIDPGAVSNDAVLENIFLGQSDAASLRALLIQSGMDENILNQINDDDLMKYYEDTLSSMNEATEQ
jgi:hypothetical protein